MIYFYGKNLILVFNNRKGVLSMDIHHHCYEFTDLDDRNTSPRETVGVVQPEEEKALGRPYSSL